MDDNDDNDNVEEEDIDSDIAEIDYDDEEESEDEELLDEEKKEEPTAEDAIIEEPEEKEKELEVEDLVKLAVESYVKRLGIYEITAILANSISTLDRGRLPLINNLDVYYFKNNSVYTVAIHEVEDRKCPISLQKGNYHMTLNDYPDEFINYRMKEIIEVLKYQHKIPNDFKYNMLS